MSEIFNSRPQNNYPEIIYYELDTKPNKNKSEQLAQYKLEFVV